MPTLHIAAQPGELAPAVLMPGDPKRAEHMAAQILDDAKLVTNIRSISGFTGYFNGSGAHHGKRLSILASGMGMPSMGIYATELFAWHGVERIIRVGTAGGISEEVNVGDVVIATGAHTTSAMNELRIPGTHFAAVADFTLASVAANAATGADAASLQNRQIHTGSVVTADHFYFKIPGQLEALQQHGVLAVEMEAASLYAVAAEYGKAALAVLTISDHLTKTGGDMSADEREMLFQDSLRLAVAAALS